MWLAVNKDGQEVIMDNKPERFNNKWKSLVFIGPGYYDTSMILPKGTIKKLTGKELTWDDEPLKFG
ncbi:MAG: fructan hydrolase [Clostridia bacterium]